MHTFKISKFINLSISILSSNLKTNTVIPTSYFPDDFDSLGKNIAVEVSSRIASDLQEMKYLIKQLLNKVSSNGNRIDHIQDMVAGK